MPDGGTVDLDAPLPVWPERGAPDRVMARIQLSFTALPAHVRTARLVAAAVVRRLGVDDEDMVDRVRLAVGEACARAVGRCATVAAPPPVEVEMLAEDGELVVLVRDQAGVAASSPGDALSMTLVQGLAARVDVQSNGATSTLRLAWPLSMARPCHDSR